MISFIKRFFGYNKSDRSDKSSRSDKSVNISKVPKVSKKSNISSNESQSSVEISTTPGSVVTTISPDIPVQEIMKPVDEENVFCSKGILLSHLKGIKVPPNATSRSIAKLLFNKNTSYADLLVNRQLTKSVPDSFVVHTHKELWSDLMDSLPIDNENPDRYIWLDIACLGQKTPLSSPVSEIRDLLEKVSMVEFVLTPFYNPISIKRSWVHFEIITAYKLNKKIHIRAPKEQIENFKKYVLSDRIDYIEDLKFLKNAYISASDSFNCQCMSDYFAIIKTINLNKNIIPFIVSLYLTDIVFKPTDNMTIHDKYKFMRMKAYIHKTTLCYDKSKECFLKCLKYIRIHKKEDLQLSLVEMGNICHLQKSYSEAIKFYTEAYNMKKTKIDIINSGITYSMAVCYADTRDYEKAISKLQECLELRKSFFGDSHPSVAEVLYTLVSVFIKTDSLENCEKLSKEALDIRRTDAIIHPEEFADSYAQVGEVYYIKKQFDLAYSSYKESYNIRKRVLGPSHIDTINVLDSMGCILMLSLKFEEARPILFQVIDLYKKVTGISSAETANAITNLATLLHKQKNLEESCRLFEQAISIYKKLGIEKSTENLKTMFKLSFVLKERDLISSSKGIGMQVLAFSKKNAENGSKKDIEFYNLVREYY
jgi:tetratricopeptide (TPR) repeat protein